MKKSDTCHLYIWLFAFMTTLVIWGYVEGRQYERSSHLPETIVRVREVCDLTITAEKKYYRWYGHCIVAGKRVDPNIIYWEDTVREEDTTKQTR